MGFELNNNPLFRNCRNNAGLWLQDKVNQYKVTQGLLGLFGHCFMVAHRLLLG